MSHRSVSQWNTYTACGERYRIERTIPGLIQRPAAWTEVGSAMASARETWEKADRTGLDLPTLFLTYYRELIAERIHDQPDFDQWQKRPNVKSVEQDIKLYEEHGIKQAWSLMESSLTSDWEVARLPDGSPAVEVQFSVQFGPITVRGAADLIKRWPNGILTVEDLKTGNKSNPKVRQLGVYSNAYNRIYGWNITLGEFWFSKDGTSSGYIDLRRYTTDYLNDQFTKLDAGIRDKIFLANPGQQCDLCGVRSLCREMGPYREDVQANQPVAL